MSYSMVYTNWKPRIRAGKAIWLSGDALKAIARHQLALLGAVVWRPRGDVLDVWDDCNKQQYVPSYPRIAIGSV